MKSIPTFITTLCFVLLGSAFHAYGQQAFVTTVDSVNRSYLVNSKGSTKEKLPLAIILDLSEDIEWETFPLSDTVLLARPIGLTKAWSLSSGDSVDQPRRNNDVLLVKEIIVQMTNNFNVDTGRVFVIGIKKAHHLGLLLAQQFPELVTASANAVDYPDIADTLNDLLLQYPMTPKEKSVVKPELESMYEQHEFYWGMGMGIWVPFGNSRTLNRDTTMADLGRTRLLLPVLHYEYWFLKKGAVWADFSVNCIKDLDFRGKSLFTGPDRFVLSGILGLKLSLRDFLKHDFFISAGSGPIVTVLEKSTTRVSAVPVQYSLGIGIHHKTIRWEIRYRRSTSLSESLGSIKWFEGLQIGFVFTGQMDMDKEMLIDSFKKQF